MAKASTVPTGRVLPNIEAENERLRRELEELKKARLNGGSISMKVGEKGGLSVYGLGRFPVTLYYEQWLKLLEEGENIRAFLEANKGKLKTRD